jgi:hypothetical protein
MAGASAERQETGVVKAVNAAVKKNKNNPITVVAGGTSITGVSGARKYTGRQASGSEPYTDVILDKKNKKGINLSLKGEAAPSLAGGGLRGLEAIVPGLAGRFMKAALEGLLAQGYKKGDKPPDVYGKIGPKTKEKIVVGTQAMGGPIDYMYIGGMDVKSTYDEKKNVLTFTNANLTESKEYAKSHELYFRLRGRRKDQRFDPDAEKAGVPVIYGKSPSKGDSAGRIVVTDSVPKNAMIVQVK